jgi:hypothetical protein
MGIDCASRDENMGLVLGEVSAGRLAIREVRDTQPEVLPILTQWTLTHNPLLLALDAPLGWPRGMGPSLASHRAGEGIPVPPDELFARHTDRFVRERTKKRPMEVGANLIARTALRAVNLLDELRTRTSLALPVASASGPPREPSVMEVYPALVLRSRGLSEVGYKGEGRKKERIRGELLHALYGELTLACDEERIVGTDHAFDAMLCALCALDFLNGDVLEPDDPDRAASEGWIWFRSPGPTAAGDPGGGVGEGRP